MMEDLDWDSLLLIVKNMPISDLLSLEKANVKCSDLVRYEIRRQLSTNIVWFDGGFNEDSYTNDDLYFNSTIDIVKVVEDYGHLIRNLKITDLDLRCDAITILKPFEAVEKLSLKKSSFEFHENNLSDMFPALRHLELYQMNKIDPFKLIVNFPHLEHLNIRRDDSFSTSIQLFELFISQNPQIRRLVV